MNRDIMTIECAKLAVLHIQEKGISPRSALTGSVDFLYQQFIRTEEKGYLEQAILHIRAFLELGFVFESGNQLFQNVVHAAGISQADLVSQIRHRGKRVKLNKMQIRRMIGKWNSKGSCMAITKVVEDIISKVRLHQIGTYYYWTGKDNKNGDRKSVYELIISDDEILFFDMQKQLYYTLMDEV